MSNPNNFYRPDVDGLRAIAILSVVIFHAFPEWFPGGYAGVDVFFVISGYLITSIILRQNKEQSFSFVEFYAKRIIRLFPSLGLVLLVTLCAGWFLLLPAEFIPLGKHAASGAGFLANISLLKEVGYFNSSSDMKPLLHLWSLGIEEQFYFLWPFILYFSWKKFPSKLIWVTGLLILSSFALNLLKISAKPEYTFYMPQTRFWELFAGCFLAVMEFNGNRPETRRINVISFAGFLLITVAFIALTRTSTFPGYWALLPVIGTSMVVYAGPGAFINRSLLSRPSLVFIGLISYPLYLWHWPLLSLNTIIHNGESPAHWRFIIVGISLILGTLSYKCWEIPLKDLSFRKRRTVVTLLLVLISASGIFGVLVWKQKIQAYHSDESFQKISDARGDWDFPGRMTLMKDEKGNRIWFQGTNQKESVFIGDSNIQQYYPRLEKVLNAHPDAMTIRYFTSGGCPPLPGTFLEGRYSNCDELMSAAFEYAERPEVQRVVIGAQWTKPFMSDQIVFFSTSNGPEVLSIKGLGFELALKKFGEKIHHLTQLGKKVFVIMNIPVGEEFDPFALLNRSISTEPIVIKKKIFLRSNWEKKYKTLFEKIKSLAEINGAIVIDPLDHFCKNDFCSTITTDGKPIYKDFSHIRPFYIIEKATFMDQTVL